MRRKNPSFKIFRFKSKSNPTRKPYQTKVWWDGTVSCNCPRWIFKRAGQDRNCPHCEDVRASMADLANSLNSKVA